MSYGSPSLNDLIDKTKAKVVYDSIQSFAPVIRRAARAGAFVFWKSDVANAFRLIPMHPLWQVRQIYKIDGRYYVDRRGPFGVSDLPHIYCAVMSLILWIAQRHFGVTDIGNLMDDTWGVSPIHEMATFDGRIIPLRQAKLLSVFNLLGVPWKWKKQLHGLQLEIIGFWLDATNLSFSLAPDRKAELVAALREFVSRPHQRLVDCQRIAGWASWGLNVFPWGRFALQALWDKLAGKVWRNAPIPINKRIQTDLRWLADALELHSGRFLLDAESWELSEADVVAYCDACPTGLGFWIPSLRTGYFFRFPPPSRDIYWAEAVSVVTAIDKLRERFPQARRILVFTDSLDSVALFSSHKPNEMLAPVLSHAVRQIIHHQVASRARSPADVRVAHVSGVDNFVADALSRGLLDTARRHVTGLRILPISPPASIALGGSRE